MTWASNWDTKSLATYKYHSEVWASGNILFPFDFKIFLEARETTILSDDQKGHGLDHQHFTQLINNNSKIIL